MKNRLRTVQNQEYHTAKCGVDLDTSIVSGALTSQSWNCAAAGQDFAAHCRIICSLLLIQGVTALLCLPVSNGANVSLHSHSGQSSHQARCSKMPRNISTPSLPVSLESNFWALRVGLGRGTAMADLPLGLLVEDLAAPLLQCGGPKWFPGWGGPVRCSQPADVAGLGPS